MVKLPQLVSKVTVLPAGGGFSGGVFNLTFFGFGWSTCSQALAGWLGLAEPSALVVPVEPPVESPPPHAASSTAIEVRRAKRAKRIAQGYSTHPASAAVRAGPCDDAAVSDPEAEESGSRAEGPRPHPTTRRVCRLLNDTVVRAPWLWPVLKLPMRSIFDRFADGWDERTGAPGAEHLASLAAGLTHVSPAPERALDVGTGTGAGALLLAREFPSARVRGVDVSPQMIAAAQAKVGLDPEGRIAFKVGDGAALPWSDESFDLLTQLNVPPFFAEINRVLRPDGHVVIAASSGDQTPFFTSDAALVRGFAKQGIEELTSGGAGRGSFWVGRRKA